MIFCSPVPILFHEGRTLNTLALLMEPPLIYSRCLFEPNARHKKMPLLFYFPFIVWMGMVKVVRDEMRVPQPAHDPISPK